MEGKIMMTKLKSLKERFINYWIESNHPIPDRKLIMAAVTVAVLAGVVSWLPHKTTGPDKPSLPRDVPSIDTFIPAGYTLVPIEIQNQESLDSVFGSHGIVDLYTSDQKGRPQKIADRIKMLRSPKNPQVFAVLVEESKAGNIAGIPGPLFVTVSSRKPSGKMPATQNWKRHRFLIHEEG
jgi:hypothetical protein